jgi:hypothetical protein
VLDLQSFAIQIEEVGELETRDATRWRLKRYAGMSVMSMLGVTRVKRIVALEDQRPAPRVRRFPVSNDISTHQSASSPTPCRTNAIVPFRWPRLLNPCSNSLAHRVGIADCAGCVVRAVGVGETGITQVAIGTGPLGSARCGDLPGSRAAQCIALNDAVAAMTCRKAALLAVDRCATEVVDERADAVRDEIAGPWIAVALSGGLVAETVLELETFAARTTTAIVATGLAKAVRGAEGIAETGSWIARCGATGDLIACALETARGCALVDRLAQRIPIDAIACVRIRIELTDVTCARTEGGVGHTHAGIGAEAALAEAFILIDLAESFDAGVALPRAGDVIVTRDAADAVDAALPRAAQGIPVTAIAGVRIGVEEADLATGALDRVGEAGAANASGAIPEAAIVAVRARTFGTD